MRNHGDMMTKQVVARFFGTQGSALIRVFEVQIDLRMLAGISAIMNQVQMKRGYGHPSDDLLE